MSSGLLKYSIQYSLSRSNKLWTCQHYRLLGYKRPFAGAVEAQPEDQNAGVLLRFLACITDPEPLRYEVQLGEAQVTAAAEKATNASEREYLLARAARITGPIREALWKKSEEMVAESL